MKDIIRFIVGLLIFIALIGSAFKIGILFGILFVLGGLYALYTGDFMERPALPVSLFAGGLITRIATNELLLPIFKSETLLDFVIAAFVFLLVYLIGQQVKNND